MILLAALLLSATPIDEAEHALAAGRVEQAERMIEVMVSAREKNERLDRLRAATAAAAGRHQEALSRYALLARSHPRDPTLADGAAHAAFRLGSIDEARRWSGLATANPAAGWRAWNLCGAIADHEGKFDRADLCYGKALALAPGRFEILNNQGWSKLLRGDWSAATDLFRKALEVQPDSTIARSNFELASAAMADKLPARRPGERQEDYAARLNDVGVIAEAAGDRKRAIAAFAQALSLRSTWSERTARNLADAEGR